MTPAQRQAATKEITALVVRETMKGIGVVDQKTQATVLEFAQAQEEKVQSVREKVQMITRALPEQTDAEVAALIQDLRKEIDAARTARKDDIATLETLVEFSKKPKLEAALMLLGLVGDETQFCQGVLGNFIMLQQLAVHPADLD